MSIIVNGNQINATDLIEQSENTIETVVLPVLDYNQATGVLTVDDSDAEWQENHIYFVSIDCDDIPVGLNTIISFDQSHERFESVYEYYNTVTKSYGFYLLHMNQQGLMSAPVGQVVGANANTVAPVVQTSGQRTDAVMSQKAVTELVGGGAGWTVEQIDLLEDFKDALDILLDHLGYDSQTGDTYADAAVNALNALVMSLRNVPRTLVGIEISTNHVTVPSGTAKDDLSGLLTVEAVYSDASRKTLVYGTTYTLTGNAVITEARVYFVDGLGDYAGYRASLIVNINLGPVLDYFTVEYNNSTPVEAGTTLAQLNEVVKAYYDNDTFVTLTEGTDYQLSGNLTAGQTNTITVTGLGDYAGLATVTFEVTVAMNVPVEITSISYTGTTLVGADIDETAFSYSIRFSNGTVESYTDMNNIALTQNGEPVSTILNEGANTIRATFIGYNTVYKDFTIVGTAEPTTDIIATSGTWVQGGTSQAGFSVTTLAADIPTLTWDKTAEQISGKTPVKITVISTSGNGTNESFSRTNHYECVSVDGSEWEPVVGACTGGFGRSNNEPYVQYDNESPTVSFADGFVSNVVLGKCSSSAGGNLASAKWNDCTFKVVVTYR